MTDYSIMPGYVYRSQPAHHDDRGLTDQAQDEVYQLARDLAEKNGYTNIIDIGCGSGYKLIKYFDQYTTVGIETEPCVSDLRQRYPNKLWHDSGQPEESFNLLNHAADLIICSDVIEHIKDPNQLINYIKTFDFKLLVLSTPDRQVLRDSFPQDYGWAAWQGPPRNLSHVREWTHGEFTDYISPHFNIVTSQHCSQQIECMVFVCEPLPC